MARRFQYFRGQLQAKDDELAHAQARGQQQRDSLQAKHTQALARMEAHVKAKEEAWEKEALLAATNHATHFTHFTTPAPPASSTASFASCAFRNSC